MSYGPLSLIPEYMIHQPTVHAHKHTPKCGISSIEVGLQT